MALNFPNSPSPGETYTDGNTTWTWNSTSNTWSSTGIAIANAAIAGTLNTQILFNDNGIANGSAELVFHKTTGNVSIGGGSPTAKLEVSGGSEVAKIRLQGNYSDKAYYTDFIQPYSGDFQIQVKTNGYDPSNVFVATPGGTPVTLLPHGNVGIGTSSPTGKLEVAGKLVVSDGDGTEVTGGSSKLQIIGGYTSPVAGRFVFGDGTGWQTHFSKYASSTLTDLFSFIDTGEFHLDGMNSGIFRLRNSPSVSNTLDFHIRPDAGNSGYITFTEDSVADRWAIGIANGSDSLLFKSGYLNGTERMRITGSGDLDVGGTIIPGNYGWGTAVGGEFGQSRYRINELNDHLWNATGRFEVKIDGNTKSQGWNVSADTFFTGNFDDGVQLPVSSNTVISINVAPSTVVYPEGSIFVSFYATFNQYANISLRTLHNNVWKTPTYTKDVSRKGSSYKVLEFGITSDNYLQEIELTVEPDGSNTVYLGQINYFLDRRTSNEELPFFDKKVALNRYFGDLTFNDKSGVSPANANTIVLKSTGDILTKGNITTDGYVGLYSADPEGYSIRRVGTSTVITSRSIVKLDAQIEGVILETPGVVVVPNGNVGIGTTSPAYKLHVNGDFAANTKSFVIDHPTKPGMKLRYGSLEGPENGVYVRGRLQSNTIYLPEYWINLVHEDSITVQLTSIGKHQNLFVSFANVHMIIVSSESTDDLDYYYTVYAERKDTDKLIIEY